MLALKPISFVKMQGLGNDFVMLKSADLPTVELGFLSRLAKTVCDRHFGIGGDGLIVAAPPTKSGFDSQFIYFNSDGSQAEMCGNGIRCFAKFVHDQELVKTSTMRVQTPVGLIQPELLSDGNVRVNMGPPTLEGVAVPFVDAGNAGYHAANRQPASIPFEGEALKVWPISMGNPHCIVFSDETPSLNPAVAGPLLETHPAFTAKTNVEFTTQLAPDAFKVVVWERGCGFTLACGTGACATAVAALLSGRSTASTIRIALPGGNLFIDWAGAASDAVFMSGPAEVSFEGILPQHWVQAALVA